MFFSINQKRDGYRPFFLPLGLTAVQDRICPMILIGYPAARLFPVDPTVVLLDDRDGGHWGVPQNIGGSLIFSNRYQLRYGAVTYTNPLCKPWQSMLYSS